jgi:hypothetical protein
MCLDSQETLSTSNLFASAAATLQLWKPTIPLHATAAHATNATVSCLPYHLAAAATAVAIILQQQLLPAAAALLPLLLLTKPNICEAILAKVQHAQV